MKSAIAWVVVACLLAGCQQPAKTSTKPATKPKPIVKNPEPAKRIIDTKPKAITSKLGGYTIVLPEGFWGCGLAEDEIAAWGTELEQLSPALKDTGLSQANALKQANGTLIAFDVRPSEVKNGFSSNISAFAEPKANLKTLIDQAKTIGRDAVEKTFNTPIGKIRTIELTQDAATVNNVAYQVRHFIYLIERKDKIHAFKLSCESTNAGKVGPDFRTSIESIAFSSN